MRSRETLLTSAAALGAAALLGTAFGVIYLNRGAYGSDLRLGQPRRERAQQAGLPQSSDPLWATLETTPVHEDKSRGGFVADFPPAVKALAGLRVTISGFVLPLEARSPTTHYLLSKYTPVCPFCPPGAPNEVVEVHSKDPVDAGAEPITVSGRLRLHGTTSEGLIFQLDAAEPGDD